MKKTAVVCGLGLLISTFLSGCVGPPAAEPIVLPQAQDISSVSIEREGQAAAHTDQEYIDRLVALLTGMEATNKASVQDFPGVEEYDILQLNCTDGRTQTLFFYEQNGKQYVEQPYQGIYIAAPGLEALITAPGDVVEKEWTEQEIREMFAPESKRRGWEVLDCAVISDFAFDRVGAVLFVDSEAQTSSVAFLDEDGAYQMCGIYARPWPESEFTYAGNGVVSFKLQTDEGKPYTCTIAFSSENGNVNFVVEDDLQL